jgi:hypothetical protein
MSLFVKPETKLLTLPSGLTLVIRKRLSQGEYRRARARMHTTDADGTVRFNTLDFYRETVIAYVVDWTLPEGDDMPIRGLDADALAAVFDNLDPVVFDEMEAAIQAHERTLREERAAKKPTSGGPTSSATSSSPATVDFPFATSTS